MNAPARKKSTATRNARIADVMSQCLKTALSPLGVARKQTMLSVLAESLVPVIEVKTKDHKNIKFWGQGGWSLYRGRSVLDKEPLTIRWIDGFAKDSLFWDIGANIGAYTIYAAAAKEIRTCCFEPSASNYAVLCKNIELNKADHLVTSFPIAFSAETKIDYLNMVATASGNTGGQFASAEGRNTNIFRQSCLGFTIDDFIASYKMPVPNYIKIDVDGIEILILKGASKTLADASLKSLLLEADMTSPEFRDIETLLGTHDFTMKNSEPTVKGRENPCNIVFSR